MDTIINDNKSFAGSVKLKKYAIKNLSEYIILQSIEDLWEKSRYTRRGSFAFFLGEGFHICSKLAGITAADRRIVLSMITKTLKQIHEQEPIDEPQTVI